jgi:TfoX/Sxy family transcriptional regulator of competence genes
MPSKPLIDRLREALAGRNVAEQRMFGGTCFMLGGNMLAGVSKQGLLVRVGKEGHAAALNLPQARPMEMGGRQMQGFVFVDEKGTATARDLNAWLKAFVETLPPKTAGERKPARRRAGTSAG